MPIFYQLNFLIYQLTPDDVTFRLESRGGFRQVKLQSWPKIMGQLITFI